MARRGDHLAGAVPITFVAFDVLYLDSEATTALPYRERRSLLEGLDLTATVCALDGYSADLATATLTTHCEVTINEVTRGGQTTLNASLATGRQVQQPNIWSHELWDRTRVRPGWTKEHKCFLAASFPSAPSRHWYSCLRAEVAADQRVEQLPPGQ